LTSQFALSIVEENISVLFEKNVPFNSVVVGIPGRITNKKDSPQTRKPDLNHDKLPDMIEQQIEELFQRLDRVETSQNNPLL
jgi:hypothetical protein